jgi:glutathionyl-hydroquinone reductase
MTNFVEMYYSTLEAEYAKKWTVEYAILNDNFIDACIYNDTDSKEVSISSVAFNQWLKNNNKLYLVEEITTNFDDTNMPIFNFVTLQELYDTDNLEFNQLLEEFIN